MRFACPASEYAPWLWLLRGCYVASGHQPPSHRPLRKNHLLTWLEGYELTGKLKAH